jgi:uncharacterized protein (TIGR00299 family) protein
MTLARIDCHALGGVAGDMFAAALFDAFPDLYHDFLSDLAQLGVGGIQAALVEQMSHGLAAKRFVVVQHTEMKPPRTLPAVITFFEQKALDPQVTMNAIEIYRLLAAAEAAVHGKPVDAVHFHEVSDWDSMVDIVAAAGIISRVNCPQWRVGALPLGGGTIVTAHGDIPIPAPATLELLKSFQWIDDGQPGERVTPTGAAILAWLKPDQLQSSAAVATLAATGVGCGTRALSDRANIFRVCAFEQSASATVQEDQIIRLAFEVDDMTGEETALAMDILRSSPGVLDVSTVAMQGKKCRPSTGVRLLVTTDKHDEVVDHCFLQTTTLGVRSEPVSRTILRRKSFSVDGYQVKSASRPQQSVTAKIESDALARTDTLQKRRALAGNIERKALDD